MSLKFNRQEKRFLYALGTSDKKQTIVYLCAVAALITLPENRETLMKLVDRLQFAFLFDSDYTDAFYHLRLEIDSQMNAGVLAYQQEIGDVENGQPWWEYGKSELVTAFCDIDRKRSVHRMNTLYYVTTDLTIRRMVKEVSSQLFRIDGNTPESYGDFLAEHHRRAKRGERLRVKEGRDKLLAYMWRCAGWRD